MGRGFAIDRWNLQKHKMKPNFTDGNTTFDCDLWDAELPVRLPEHSPSVHPLPLEQRLHPGKHLRLNHGGLGISPGPLFLENYYV